MNMLRKETNDDRQTELSSYHDACGAQYAADPGPVPMAVGALENFQQRRKLGGHFIKPRKRPIFLAILHEAGPQRECGL
jgi:hypothetical protein